MSFTIANWACISNSLNQGQETVTPYGGSSTVLNAPNIFMYGSPNDTAATIVAANYFLTQYASLSVGDWIMGFGTDTSFAVQVTAVSSTSVTVASTGITTSIGTSNIVNNAVTFAKMQEIATVTLLGNPTGGTTEVSEVTLGSGLEFSSTTLRVPQTYLRYTTVAITAAQFNGMYASPKLLVAAGGANTLLVLEQLQLAMTYVSANYAAGGVAAVQYDSTANGAGVIASSTLSAATFQAAASTTFTMNSGVVPLPFATTVNKGLYLSNITGAFTTGDSTFVAHVWYRVIPTV
jgi:hypothetical protein